jgi:hypothetical protein
MRETNPGILKLELFCRGARVDGSCTLDADTRPIKRTRGGLGSGLDAILPEDVWVNIPIVEPFAQSSPYIIRKDAKGYSLWKDDELLAPLKLPPRPAWYEQTSSSGKRFGDIGVMQGTYFAVYPSDLCGFWTMQPRKNCRFCSVGLCIGKTESERKSVQDVVEAVLMARKHERITFVHFNTGFYEDDRALDVVMPYVEAVRKRTGLLVGVQCPPARDLSKYDRLRKAGADHVSFCFELFDSDRFAEICPGKAGSFGKMAASLEGDPLLNEVNASATRHLGGMQPHPGQLPFYRAIAYCTRLWGKGRVSGEIIAGLESPESSIAAIDFLAAYGVVATVCVFRPCVGTDLELHPPPHSDELGRVFARMHEACLGNRIPTGIAPNIKTAMVHLPDEGRYFTSASAGIRRRLLTRATRAAMGAGLSTRRWLCGARVTLLNTAAKTKQGDD